MRDSFCQTCHRILTSGMAKLLFICAHNKDRSVTAASLFEGHPHHSVRARGVSKRAVTQVTADDLVWAEKVFVMEPKHERRLRREYRGILKDRDVTVLDVPDDYKCMDEPLVAILRSKLARLLLP